VDALAEFAALVVRPDAALDRLVALVAAHVRPPVPVDHLLGTLDDLAAVSGVRTFDDLRRFMGSELGFVGNVADYGDPENSMLDAVLAWRTGIPITLSTVFASLGARCGLSIEVIGMPGHVLVRDAVSGRFCDPFGGCALLDVDGCRRVHDMVFDGRRRFDPRELVVLPPSAVCARVLSNLEQGRLAADRLALRRVLQLHASIPGLDPADGLALAGRLAAVGDHARAARLGEDAVDRLTGEARRVAQRVVASYWAATN
jgi:regulator of sirC expression with transglutaminase-like and TPR domain